VNPTRRIVERIAGEVARVLGRLPIGVAGVPTSGAQPHVEFLMLGADGHRGGSVQVRMVPAHRGSLVADVEVGGRVRASCVSNESIQVRGRFKDGTQLRLAADGPVRLVARTHEGTVVAGPIEIRPERPWATLRW
jgi:hypothetical protein